MGVKNEESTISLCCCTIVIMNQYRIVQPARICRNWHDLYKLHFTTLLRLLIKSCDKC